MAATAFELLAQAGAIVCGLEDAGGDLTDELDASIKTWLDNADDKLGAMWAVQRRLAAEDEVLKMLADRLAGARKRLAKNKERVNEMATQLLLAKIEVGEEPKVKRPEFSAWLATTRSVLGPTDPADWPEDLRTEVTQVVADRAGAKKLLEGGAQLPGFQLVESTGVRWR